MELVSRLIRADAELQKVLDEMYKEGFFRLRGDGTFRYTVFYEPNKLT